MRTFALGLLVASASILSAACGAAPSNAPAPTADPRAAASEVPEPASAELQERASLRGLVVEAGAARRAMGPTLNGKPLPDVTAADVEDALVLAGCERVEQSAAAPHHEYLVSFYGDGLLVTFSNQGIERLPAKRRAELMKHAVLEVRGEFVLAVEGSPDHARALLDSLFGMSRADTLDLDDH